ncbi:MAG: hypothetical protein JW993_04870 [Sedimentisphaerales bacterium]|nr:hypothetical protein [Sedimentisphaerales bacterium]
MIREPEKSVPSIARLSAVLGSQLGEIMDVRCLKSLAAAAESIDGHLCAFLENTLMIYPQLLFEGSAHNALRNAVQRGNSLYRPRVRESALEPGVVEVALLKVSGRPPRNRPDPIDVTLEGHGRLHIARLWLPPNARVNQDTFSDLTASLFRTGYVWLEERIRDVINKPELSIGSALYAHLRSNMCDELLTQVWFGCGHSGRGVFLVDSRFGMDALSLINRGAPKAGESPLCLLLAFLGCDIPVEKTFGTIAITQDSCLDFSLASANYRTDLPLLVRAQIAMCAGEGISVLPICRDGRTYLIASFPTREKVAILPILQDQRAELARLHKGTRRLIRKFQRQFVRPAGLSLVDTLGAFSGSFLASWMKQMGQP